LRIQRDILWNVCKLVARSLGINGGIDSAHGDGARVRRKKTKEQVDGCCLSRTVSTEQAEEFSRGNGKIQTVNSD